MGPDTDQWPLAAVAAALIVCCDFSPPYRSHAIGIYHSETGPVLRSLLRGKP